tara:strand:+ start:5814 stop:6050 length:237 start_codon:yes stop_codon:yes gene_type:complete
MIYRRKNIQKRNTNTKPNNSVKHYDQQPSKQTKNPKKQRLIQVEAEIQELAHKSSYESQDQMDKLMLERWQLRYQLNL